MFYDDLPVSTLNNQKISDILFRLLYRFSQPSSILLIWPFDGCFKLVYQRKLKRQMAKPQDPSGFLSYHICLGLKQLTLEELDAFCTKQKNRSSLISCGSPKKCFPIDSYIGFLENIPWWVVASVKHPIRTQLPLGPCIGRPVMIFPIWRIWVSWQNWPSGDWTVGFVAHSSN